MCVCFPPYQRQGNFVETLYEETVKYKRANLGAAPGDRTPHIRKSQRYATTVTHKNIKPQRPLSAQLIDCGDLIRDVERTKHESERVEKRSYGADVLLYSSKIML